MDQLEPIFTLRALERNIVSSNTCFLCAKFMPPSSVSQEHIIPAWVQDEFGLRDLRITLRNNTHIQYKNAKIPCCKQCNNEHLSDLENFISSKFKNGKNEIREIPNIAWYLWIGKIRLALIYKDCLIAQDQRDPNSITLGDPTELHTISNIRHILQFIRFQKNAWLHIPRSPDSVLQFSCQDPVETNCRWDIHNLLDPFTTAIRMGPVGVIVAFRDESFIVNHHSQRLLPYRFIDLHPMQFIEVLAKTNWLAKHQVKYSNYKTIAGVGKFHVETIKAWKNNTNELFTDLNNSLYPEILHEMQQIEQNKIPHGKICSVLSSDDPYEILQLSWSKCKALRAGQLNFENATNSP